MLREIAARFGYVPKQEFDNLEEYRRQLHDVLSEQVEKIMQLEGKITDLNERLERARHEWMRYNKFIKEVNVTLETLYKKHGVSQTMLELLSSQFGQLNDAEINAAPMTDRLPAVRRLESIVPATQEVIFHPVTVEQAAARNIRNETGKSRKVVDILKRDMHLSSGKEVITGLRIIGLPNRYGITVSSQHMLYYIPAIKILMTRGVNKSVAVDAIGSPWKRIADYLTGTCVYKVDREVINRIALWFGFNPGDFEAWCLFQHQAQLDGMNVKRQTKRQGSKVAHQMTIEEGKEDDDENTDVKEDIVIDESGIY